MPRTIALMMSKVMNRSAVTGSVLLAQRRDRGNGDRCALNRMAAQGRGGRRGC
jgi:hypothetical protein